MFLSIEHTLRLTQDETRSQLQGKFLREYWTSVKSIRGWGDGDSVLTNYVAHPMQGGVAGFIHIQNDPDGIGREFKMDSAYWRSRFKAMGWAAVYMVLEDAVAPRHPSTVPDTTPDTDLSSRRSSQASGFGRACSELQALENVSRSCHRAIRRGG